MTTRLLQDFVCLKFPDLPKEHKLDCGITIGLPDKRYFQRTTRDAVVVAVGPGKWVEAMGNRAKREHWHPTQLKVGDRVLIDAMLTQEGLLTEWDGERGDFRMVREEAISAVLDADVELEVA